MTGFFWWMTVPRLAEFERKPTEPAGCEFGERPQVGDLCVRIADPGRRITELDLDNPVAPSPVLSGTPEFQRIMLAAGVIVIGSRTFRGGF